MDTTLIKARCFVIQPFGKRTLPSGKVVDNNEIYSVLKRLEHTHPNFPIQIYRADTENIKDSELHQHVVKCILESDFCIADFSGRNVNVVYETGIAKGLGKKVIVICQDRSNDIPTDLKGWLVEEYSSDNVEKLLSSIGKYFQGIKDLLACKPAQETGIKIPYFCRRDDKYICNAIKSAKIKIDILQTNLSTIASKYLEFIQESLDLNPELELRILTLDPDSIFVNFRGQQLGHHRRGASNYRKELVNSLKSAKRALKSFGDRARIKVYDDFPTQITFFFDNDILVSVVSATGKSRYNCSFLVNSSLPGAQKSFIEHFDYLWNHNSYSI